MHLVVVGGGITGLAAALEASRVRPDAQITVLEGASRLGGKLQVSCVGGLPVDEGADALLRRRPEGIDLAVDVGLGEELISPATAAASVWSRGALRPLPAGTLLGVPTDLRELARSGLISAAGLARVPLDFVLPGPVEMPDEAVGALVTRRLGREVVERLVDPLLGGVYAGHADQLSVHATLPQLGPGRSLLQAASRARGTPAAGPVFGGLAGGLGRLPAAVATASGARIRLDTTVRGLAATPTGWRLETGSAAAPEFVDADAVILAVPAGPAARLLGPHTPAAAGLLAQVGYASVAIVTLVLAAEPPGAGSGFLVPAVEGRTTKAVTFHSRKWPHGSGDLGVVRASVGRYGEQLALQRTDAELVTMVTAELADVVGPLPALVDSRVVRWGGALPQYAVGHLDLVAHIRTAVSALPRLAVAGAAYDGVGVPAVIRSGREAARAVLAQNGGHDRTGAG
ncbi:MAG TPA: protoporphyrinogen oxidase [Mycobacteriales bacterium]|nr:protoporphyrinogen oxidase [Mycobacteriales bacterium]